MPFPYEFLQSSMAIYLAPKLITMDSVLNIKQFTNFTWGSDGQTPLGLADAICLERSQDIHPIFFQFWDYIFPPQKCFTLFFIRKSLLRVIAFPQLQYTIHKLIFLLSFQKTQGKVTLSRMCNYI